MDNDDTPLGRVLRLLALLQTRREWSGSELADRLGVTSRTVRRDIDRLRELGYPIEATAGQSGGYRLGTGGKLPPLLLDDTEAIAVAIALTTAGGATGLQPTALRALAKIEQLLPDRLRHQVAAVGQATVGFPADRSATDPKVLAVLAAACRDHEIVSFDYRSRHDTNTSRRVEPHTLLAWYGRWYLVAHDTHHDDWRTFRVDRITAPTPTRHHAPPRQIPGGDPLAYLQHALATAPYRYTATATVHAPADVVRAHSGALPDRIRPLDRHRCQVDVSDNSLEYMAQHLLALGAEFTLDTSNDTREQLQHIATRLHRSLNQPSAAE